VEKGDFLFQVKAIARSVLLKPVNFAYFDCHTTLAFYEDYVKE
jgi:hypothetical protein